MANEPSFKVVLTADTEPGEKLLLGTAGAGVAGLTAADYLVTHIETNQIGHLKTQNLPDITPFTDGTPRHPIRLYSATDSDITVLISEVFLPVWVADPLAEAVLTWTDGHGINEITILHGTPFPHSEAEHLVFHVGTESYRAEHFTDGESAIDPLAGGFFDGLIGELMIRSMDHEAPPTGVLITPTHPPGPDFDAALRLLDTLEQIYGIEVDEAELQERADEMKQYYEELAQRMQALQETAQTNEEREYPSDRMYM